MRARTLLLTAAAAWLGTAGTATAQIATPVFERSADIFGHVGWFRAGSDEGTIASGVTFGGVILLSVWKSIAVELDVQTGAVENSQRFLGGGVDYKTRRTLLTPSVLYRFGRQGLYGFVGAGFGAELEDSTSRQTGVRPSGQSWREIEPGVFQLNQSEVNGRASFRGGVSAFNTHHVGLRGEVFVAGWHAGARVALGYRFDSLAVD